jgi:hypothetical protein
MKRRLQSVSRGSLVHARGCSAQIVGRLWQLSQGLSLNDITLREPVYNAALWGARLQWETMG